MKTGYLLIAHGALASELLRTLEFIAGPQPSFRAVAVDHAVEVDMARQIVEQAINEMMGDGDGGVVVLTDLFGGAPSNIAMSMMDDKRMEIVAGVNLPLLIHATLMEDNLSLKEKAQRLRDYGRNNIFVASEVLSGRR
ncbi:MAG: PTS fructose transporter subunit IIA [Nitrospinae bacterium]|nr:PTS fructose transporter subunit IIA [Nitrospinota bacterium]